METMDQTNTELQIEKADLIEEIKKLKSKRNYIGSGIKVLKSEKNKLIKNIYDLKTKEMLDDFLFVKVSDIKVMAITKSEARDILTSKRRMLQVNVLIDRFKKYGNLEPITLYRNMLFNGSVEYTAYCIILNLSVVKVNNVTNIDDLNKKTRNKILNSNLDINQF